MSQGKVEIKSNTEYYEALSEYKKKKTIEDNRNENKKNYSNYIYDKDHFTKGLTMQKTIQPSIVNANGYNATFLFNNGVIATYSDGNMVAVQDGKSQKIRSNYLIYCKEGIIKLSFRPKTKETWWVFEPIEESKN